MRRSRKSAISSSSGSGSFARSRYVSPRYLLEALASDGRVVVPRVHHRFQGGVRTGTGELHDDARCGHRRSDGPALLQLGARARRSQWRVEELVLQTRPADQRFVVEKRDLIAPVEVWIEQLGTHDLADA